MSSGNHRDSSTSLSVVIASYNSAPWLPSTLESLAAALVPTSWNAEVVVVDDGSTDDTATVLETLQHNFPVPLRVVRQENKGRFLARWEGIQAARSDTVLLVDSRLLTHTHSLDYVLRAIEAEPGATTWNGHVVTDPAAPLVGHFWSVPTYLFWGDYLSHPRPTLITPENFDRLPKGTGFLLISKNLFERACLDAWPAENAHLTSDDTKLLRFVAAETAIRLDPGFSATYRPRTSITQFLLHAWGRGTLFVDSYAGTSALRNALLILLIALPPLLLIALVVAAFGGAWPAVIVVAALAIAGLGAPAAIAATRGCPLRAVRSYLTFVLPFGVVFWAGLVRGLAVHRKSFNRNSRTTVRGNV